MNLPNPNPDNLVWLDLEMTGLDPERDHIIEIATIITDSQLNIIAEGPAIAIYQPDSILDLMDDWNVKQHNGSGLVARVKKSQYSLIEAEEMTLDFVMQYVPPNKSPLCGNSIGQDRRFLYKYMPALQQYLHYRNLDVSSIKEVVRRWYPNIAKGFSKTSTHLALQDIYDSIEELKFYRSEVFK